MRHHTKRVLAALLATLAMALALTSTTSARVLSLSNMNFRVVWTALEFTNETGFGTIRCRMTLEGSFHSQTISKVEKALIGHVSRATIAEATCTGATMTVHQESLPWHLTYNGFRGILPRINSIRLLLYRPQFQLQIPFFGTCNLIANAEHEIRGEAILNASGDLENIIPDPTVAIPTNVGCPSESVRFRAAATDGRITLLGTTTRIRVTLI